MKARDEKDQDELKSEIEYKAKQGDPDAQCKLADLFWESGDIANAEKWFLAAAMQGHPPSEFQLGEFYARNYGNIEDHREKAKHWYEIAANHGYAPAQLAFGRGLLDNWRLGTEWIEKAALQGLAEAQCEMGSRLERGENTIMFDLPEDYEPLQKDEKAAFEWYQKAAQQGDRWAQYKLAEMYSNGVVTPRDDKTAFHWYQKSAEQGHENAQLALADMLFEGRGTPQDLIQAAKYYYMTSQCSYFVRGKALQGLTDLLHSDVQPKSETGKEEIILYELFAQYPEDESMKGWSVEQFNQIFAEKAPFFLDFLKNLPLSELTLPNFFPLLYPPVQDNLMYQPLIQDLQKILVYAAMGLAQDLAYIAERNKIASYEERPKAEVAKWSEQLERLTQRLNEIVKANPEKFAELILDIAGEKYISLLSEENQKKLKVYYVERDHTLQEWAKSKGKFMPTVIADRIKGFLGKSVRLRPATEIELAIMQSELKDLCPTDDAQARKDVMRVKELIMQYFQIEQSAAAYKVSWDEKKLGNIGSMVKQQWKKIKEMEDNKIDPQKAWKYVFYQGLAVEASAESKSAAEQYARKAMQILQEAREAKKQKGKSHG